MAAWTDPTAGPERPPGVVLHPARLDAVAPPLVLAPAPELATLVDRHWIIRWDLPAPTRLPSSLVPDLCHNITRELGTGRPHLPYDAVVVTGVSTRRFDVDLTGRGFVLGTKWRPGALAAVTDIPAAVLTDRNVLARELLPASVVDAYAGGLDPGDPEAFRHTVERALAPLVDQADPAWTQARDVVSHIATQDITTVAELVAAAGLGERSLQRLFRRFVGVSPKQAITRYRLHDVVDALDRGTGEPLADLAARLGFFDQAHLAREFTRFVGISPSAYRAGRAVRPDAEDRRR